MDEQRVLMWYKRFTRSCAGHGIQHPNRQKTSFSVSVVPFLDFGSRMKGEGHSASTKPGGTAARWRPAWSLVTIGSCQKRSVFCIVRPLGMIVVPTCRVEIVAALIRLKCRVSNRWFCIAVGNKRGLSRQGENVTTGFIDLKTCRCASHPHFLFYKWCQSCISMVTIITWILAFSSRLATFGIIKWAGVAKVIVNTSGIDFAESCIKCLESAELLFNRVDIRASSIDWIIHIFLCWWIMSKSCL